MVGAAGTAATQKKDTHMVMWVFLKFKMTKIFFPFTCLFTRSVGWAACLVDQRPPQGLKRRA